MTNSISKLCAVAAALATFGVSAAVPASAASFQNLVFSPDTAQVTLVQNRARAERPRAERPRVDNPRRAPENHRGFERRGGSAYFNGHRGFHQRREGYHQFNGFWFPPAAFAFGALAGGLLGGGLINNDQVLIQQHLQWCESHYRSYRASDNTFQPYHGPRQQCISPYLQ